MSSSNNQTNSINRGQACIHCRRRKLRCDGQRPICGTCSRTRQPGDCEYTDTQGRTRAEILEETIAQMQSRIRELENPGAFSSEPVYLQHPYAQRMNRAPAEGEQMALIQKFIPHVSDLSFFLDVSYFKASALLPHAPNPHPSRPISALMSAVYLWGIHLSQDESLLRHREAYLARAVSQVSTSLSGSHAEKVLQTIQAEILLAVYFFTLGRLLEGKYHLATATSITIATGLTKARAGESPLTNTELVVRVEIERIDACWTVVALDQIWAVALASSANMSESMRNQLETPWPVDDSNYESGQYPHNMLASKTISDYLEGKAQDTIGLSGKALYAKAAILWSKATDLITRWEPNMSPAQTGSFRQEFNKLDYMLEQLRVRLVRPENLKNAPHREFMTHNLVCAALLQLHGPFSASSERSQQKMDLAGKHVFRIVGDVELRSWAHFMDPIVGVSVCVHVCQYIGLTLDVDGMGFGWRTSVG
ncbi:hypothetical protein CYLTODRAFT_357149 [Cylindrobasidium torrendii FP15055 ss-10]|uniref:Zn(2)-C6 fungal-type domain-containing protein n=1 Tax=Cylindrobasidium torrendii FP15055 ss-10 TaxID=1314674 RepID=A0A0D7B6T7_9AGAR|nr:hypothetical protein CYLTODRAFT_357149 [Cylindrobasidium torrendii FP15055 ss-10]